MKLYELERDKGTKIYGFVYRLKARPIIFGHIDGAYSYCWFEGKPKQVVHLSASTPLTPYKDGYVIEDTDMKALELLAA